MENFFDSSFLFSKDPMFLCSHVKGSTSLRIHWKMNNP